MRRKWFRVVALIRMIRSAFARVPDRTWMIFGVTLIWAFVFRDYLLCRKVFIFNLFAIDSLSQFYPLDYFRIKNVVSGMLPFWSFQLDMGASTYSLMANISPFDLLLVPFGPDSFHLAAHLVVLLKFFAASLFFHAFLRRLEVTPAWAVTGALLFTFNGYMMVNSHWYHYTNYAVFMALFLLFFEVWFQEGRWLPLVLILGLVPLKGELQLFQMVFFGTVYVLFRCVNVHGWSWRSGRTFLFLAFFFFLGICVQSYLILPNILSMLSSSRGLAAMDGASGLERLISIIQVENWETLKAIFARMMANDLLGSWMEYRGPLNYFEDSTLYSGIMTLLLLPLCLLPNNQVRLLWVFPLTCGIVCLFPQVRWTLNGYASGTFKYLSLYLSTFCLIGSTLLLQNSECCWVQKNATGKRNLPSFVLVCWGLVIAFFLCALWVGRETELQVDGRASKEALLFVSGYVILLLLLSRLPGNGLLRYALVGMVALELALFSRQTAQGTQGALSPAFVDQKQYYFASSTKEALSRIRDMDASFYRVEKGYLDGHLNDALVQGYNGTSAYYGFVSSGITSFYRNFGLSYNSPRLDSYRYGLEKRGDLQTLLGVKYYLCRTDEECDGLQGFAPVDVVDGVRIFQNQNLHGGARMYYAQCPAVQYNNLPMAQKEALIREAVITETVLPHLDLNCLPDEKNSWAVDWTKAGDRFILEQWDHEYFKGTIMVTRPGMLFFPIPFDRGWQAQVDGNRAPLHTLDYGFMGVALYEPGQREIVLQYRPPFLGLAVSVSLVGLLVSGLLSLRFPRLGGVQER